MFQANLTSAKMLMQYRDGMEKVATFTGMDFGGTGGPMAVTAIRKWQEPLGVEPDEPTGIDAAPGTAKMIKWKVKWEEYSKKSKKWEEEVNPRLFNLLFAHCTTELRALLQGRDGWEDMLDDQDGVALVKLLHAIHHLQDESKPGM